MICAYFNLLDKHVLEYRMYQSGVLLHSQNIGEGQESLPVCPIAIGNIN